MKKSNPMKQSKVWVFLLFLLCFSMTVSASWKAYYFTPQEDVYLYNVITRPSVYAYEKSWNETRSDDISSAIANTGTLYIGAYRESGANHYYHIYRPLLNFNTSTADYYGFSLPSNSYAMQTKLFIHSKKLGSDNLTGGIYVAQCNSTKIYTTNDWDCSNMTRFSSAIGTYPLRNNWFSDKYLWFNQEQTINLTLNANATNFINYNYRSKINTVSLMLFSGNDTKDVMTLHAKHFGAFASNENTTSTMPFGVINYQPYLLINVSLMANGTYPLFYGKNGTNASNLNRTGQKIQLNITPYVIGNDNTNKYIINYSSYKDGIGYYYGSVGWTAWNNNTNLRRVLKANYSDGGWFYYSWNFTSIKGKTIRVSHNYTDLHYQPSYFYLAGNWSNLTQTTQPSKYYNFTSTLRTNGYPQTCKYWYEAGAIKNNITFPCDKGTNITIKNQTKFLLTNFSFAGWYRWKYWANSTTGVSNASKWSNVSGYNFLFVDNCSDLKNKTLVMYFHDEDHPATRINVWIEITLNTTDAFGFPVSWSGYMNGKSNYSLCYNINFTTAVTDIYFKYYSQKSTAPVYNRYYHFRKQLNGTLTNLSLYILNTTSGLSTFTINLRHNSNYTVYRGLISKLQRKYVSEGLWRTVQMDSSDDFGRSIYNIREQTADYRLVYYDKNNNLIYQGQTMKLLCTAGACEVSYLISPYSAVTIARLTGLKWSFSNSTGLLNITWNDLGGTTTSVHALATQYLADRSLIICNKTASGASGNFSCDLSTYTGTVYFQVFSTGSPQRWDFSKWLNIQPQIWLPNRLQGGESEAAFYGFFMMLGIGTASLTMGIVGFVIAIPAALTLLYFMHFLSFLSVTFIILGIVASIVILIKLRR
jgi:hypothetical protein